MKINALLLCALAATTAQASNVDRDAGTCAGYMTLLKKSPGAVETVLRSGDNTTRTLNFAKQWMNQVQRHGDGQAAAHEGDRACRRIGIRPSDYR